MLIVNPIQASVPVITRKDLEPRDDEASAGTAAIKARALDGFDRALRYAEAGLEKGPKVTMGTGPAGVGILVDNNLEAAARPNE